MKINNEFEYIVEEMFGCALSVQNQQEYLPSWPVGDWNDIADYMTNLFENSRSVLASYFEAQIAVGLKFLDTAQSDAMFALVEEDVSWMKRQRCIDSMLKLFENVFKLRCSDELCFPDAKVSNPLNHVCSSWFEWLPIHGHPESPERDKELVDPEFIKLLKSILFIESEICIESALIGLGNWNLYYPSQVSEIIDEFLLVKPSLRTELKYHAELAKKSLNI